MTKRVKVAESTNLQLDWMVLSCEVQNPSLKKSHARMDGTVSYIVEWDSPHESGGWEYLSNLDYTTNWSQMGPIIEREGITASKEDGNWNAYFRDNLFEEDGSEHWSVGQTPLIAAARCYVASKLGDEVEVPEELS